MWVQFARKQFFLKAISKLCTLDAPLFHIFHGFRLNDLSYSMLFHIKSCTFDQHLFFPENCLFCLSNHFLNHARLSFQIFQQSRSFQKEAHVPQTVNGKQNSRYHSTNPYWENSGDLFRLFFVLL